MQLGNNEIMYWSFGVDVSDDNDMFIFINDVAGNFFVYDFTKYAFCHFSSPMYMVPKVGVEPTRCHHHEILSLARLPVSPLRPDFQIRLNPTAFMLPQP